MILADEMFKTIEISILEVTKMIGGDAGDTYDAEGEAIILAIQTNKIVRLKLLSGIELFDPAVLRSTAIKFVP